MKLYKIHQRFAGDRLDDVAGATRAELSVLRDRIPAGGTIAVTAGSRGITGIVPIMRTTVSFVRKCGAVPFVVPAMGSHGGATAEGQREILADYGITEPAIGAPIRSSMETVEVPRAETPCPVFMDKCAWESDGVILVNRVKPHTDFHGPYESGLVKMTVIGLGKHDQALAVHRLGVTGLREVMPRVAERIYRTGKVLGGLAIVENAYDQTMLVRGVPAEEILDMEPGLLERARGAMPRLPVDEIDILVVDRLGKNISGVGMDPNIIGRMMIRGVAEPERPRVTTIVVCDVTGESHGNVLGMGLADVTTRRLFDKIDFHALNENVYTSTFFERAKIPVVAGSDAEAFDFALRNSGPVPAARKRIVRIRDTQHLSEAYVSKSILDTIDRGSLDGPVGPAVEILDSEGRLAPF